MAIFVALFIYLVLIHVFSLKYSGNKSRIIQTVACGLGLWVVLALRSPLCGCDLLKVDEMGGYGKVGEGSYAWVFSDVKSKSWIDAFIGFGSYSSRMEKGWLVLNKAVGSFAPYFQSFLVVLAAIQVICIGYVIYKKSEDIVMSFLVYFCFGLYIMSFSGLRQASAYAVTFLASYFLMNGKVKKFVIGVLVASTLHQSALIVLLAIFLRKMRISYYQGIRYLIIVFMVAPFMDIITIYILGSIWGGRYGISAGEGSATTMIFVYAVIFVISLFNKQLSSDDKFTRIMVLAAVACQSLGFFSAGPTTRIGYYFQMFFLLLFPSIVNFYGRQYKNKEIVWFSMSAVLFLFFYLVNSGGYLDIIPYRFMWETPEYIFLM